jgi:hypothetical protein
MSLLFEKPKGSALQRASHEPRLAWWVWAVGVGGLIAFALYRNGLENWPTLALAIGVVFLFDATLFLVEGWIWRRLDRMSGKRRPSFFGPLTLGASAMFALKYGTVINIVDVDALRAGGWREAFADPLLRLITAAALAPFGWLLIGLVRFKGRTDRAPDQKPMELDSL